MIGTLTKIVSGAQTGADRGALDAALAAGLQIGGWAPSSWVYDVPGQPSVAVEYRKYMRLTSSQTTGMVARLNVQDSDATLLLSFAHELTGHEEFVLRQVKAQRKPCKHLVLPRGRGVVPAEVTSAVWEWLQTMRVGVLNVAGPRESKEPGIQAAAKRVIAGLLRAKQDADTAAALALQDAEADAMMATEAAQAAEERAESLRRMIDMGLQMRPASPTPIPPKQLEWMDKAKAATVESFYIPSGEPWQVVEVVPPSPFAGVHRGVAKPDPKVWDVGGLPAPTPQEFLPVAVPVAVFIADCSIAECSEDFTRKRTGLIDRYYAMDGNGAGGSLHIVLDDGNHDRDSVQFCLDWAIREGDRAGEALARALLALPDDVYVQVLPPMEDPCEGCGGVEGLHAADCKGGTDV